MKNFRRMHFSPTLGAWKRSRSSNGDARWSKDKVKVALRWSEDCQVQNEVVSNHSKENYYDGGVIESIPSTFQEEAISKPHNCE